LSRVLRNREHKGCPYQGKVQCSSISVSDASLAMLVDRQLGRGYSVVERDHLIGRLLVGGGSLFFSIYAIVCCFFSSGSSVKGQEETILRSLGE